MKLALGAERPYSSDEILEKTDGGMKETEWLCVISERQGNFAKIDEYERNKGIVFSSNVSVSHALSVSESKDLPKETISQKYCNSSAAKTNSTVSNKKGSGTMGNKH